MKPSDLTNHPRALRPQCLQLRALAMAALVALAAPARAGIITIYQQSFDTDTTDLLTDCGFSMWENASWTPAPKVESGVAVWDGGPGGPVGYDFKMWTAIPSSFTYDWSQPLTYSIDIGSQSGGGGQSYGIFLGTSAQPANAGVSYNFMWPSGGGGSFFGSGSAGDPRIHNDTNPDVTAGTTLFTVALTVRQNAGDTGKFDYRVTVNGTAQTTVAGSLPSGVTQDGDWYVGLSKATYGIDGADPFRSLGIRADGLGYNSYLDNMKLETVSTKEATTTTLEALPSPSVAGQSVTFTATVKDSESNNIPTGAGTVEFKSNIGGILIAAAPIENGVATYSTSALIAGAHKITATYWGNSTYEGSASSELTQTVNPAGAGAGTIYQQSFGTDTTDLLPEYGFSMWETASWTPAPKVVGGVAVWDGGPTGPVGYDLNMWTAIPSSFTYDWSQPLTYSIDIGSQSNGGGQSYGLLMTPATSLPAAAGLSYNFYWPSGGGGSFFGAGDANNNGTRISNDTNPDVTAGTTRFTVAFTVRQNAGDAGKFDYRVAVNGTAQTTVTSVLPLGVTQDGDWYVGLSKATYGINGADPFRSLGIRADGLGYNSYFDNLKLEIASAKLATSTTLGSSAPSSYIDDLVTFTATVKVGEVNVPTGAGTVEFKSDIDGVLDAAATITDGVATCPTRLLSFGPHTITATYSGDSTHLGSSTTLSHSVIRTAFGTWANTNITVKQSGADATSMGDPDGDGSNNLTEYAFGGDPLSGSDNAKVFSQFKERDISPNGKELILTVAVLADTPALEFAAEGNSLTATSTSGGITYRIEGSNNLVFPGGPEGQVSELIPAEATTAMVNVLPASGYVYRSFVLSAGGTPAKGFLRAVVTK